MNALKTMVFHKSERVNLNCSKEQVQKQKFSSIFWCLSSLSNHTQNICLIFQSKFNTNHRPLWEAPHSRFLWLENLNASKQACFIERLSLIYIYQEVCCSVRLDFYLLCERWKIVYFYIFHTFLMINFSSNLSCKTIWCLLFMICTIWKWISYRNLIYQFNKLTKQWK